MHVRSALSECTWSLLGDLGKVVMGQQVPSVLPTCEISVYVIWLGQVVLTWVLVTGLIISN